MFGALYMYISDLAVISIKFWYIYISYMNFKAVLALPKKAGSV